MYNMTYNSFIEYLVENGFIDPEDDKFKYSIPTKIKPIQNAKEIVNDLRSCLEYLRDNKLRSFKISARDINTVTIKYWLKKNGDFKDVKELENTNTAFNISSTDVKTKVINAILNIRSLEYYLLDSSNSDNDHIGWVYTFIVPNFFKEKVRACGKVGSMLYLKFNFLKCYDDNGRINVEQSQVKIDVISFHPTNSTKIDKRGERVTQK